MHGIPRTCGVSGDERRRRGERTQGHARLTNPTASTAARPPKMPSGARTGSLRQDAIGGNSGVNEPCPTVLAFDVNLIYDPATRARDSWPTHDVRALRA